MSGAKLSKSGEAMLAQWRAAEQWEAETDPRVARVIADRRALAAERAALPLASPVPSTTSSTGTRGVNSTAPPQPGRTALGPGSFPFTGTTLPQTHTYPFHFQAPVASSAAVNQGPRSQAGYGYDLSQTIPDRVYATPAGYTAKTAPAPFSFAASTAPVSNGAAFFSKSTSGPKQNSALRSEQFQPKRKR